MDDDSPHYRLAREDFRRARRLAVLKEISARLQGKPTSLLPFETVRKYLKPSGEKKRGLQTIPLDAIVGSVGRYNDFTRDFLPRSEASASRWVRVRAAIRLSGQIRPIDVYQIGEVYFVLDGNHRVSVARERGLREIPAYVTEIQTKVPLTPEMDFNDLILKAEYTLFLEQTHLDESIPGVDLSITVPGRYQVLGEQIELQRQQSPKENGQPPEIQEAARQWYLQIYLPVIEIIRDGGILRDFPDRTETDLYVWISEHQEKFRQNFGWKLEPRVIASDLAEQHGSSATQIFSRARQKAQALMVPPFLKTGPRPGSVRAHQAKIHAHDPAHLFTHMLMPLNGTEESWQALEMGLRLAWREEAHLLGLHIVPNEPACETAEAAAIQERFKQHCADVGVPGEMAVDFGPIVPVICEHARLSDLVIIHLAHPPEDHPIMRVGSGIRRLIQQSPRPILTIPKAPEKLDRLLVAYNGGAKSTEALYAAAYFAGRWEVPLYVLTVAEPGRIKPKTVNYARFYLRERQIPATLIEKRGRIADAILESVAENECNLIFMGAYSKPPVLEMVLGSPLDQVLRESPVPVLICR
ncbi:MAG TPA: universal stress protein UspA [Chloroflexi bacterium]|nr:universal stress protein UspA [Chloroflexota bacterium]